MNWGKGLVIGMLVFISFIVGLSVYMFKAPTDEYDHQYYEKGLAYNQEYKQQQQTLTDNAQPAIEQIAGFIVIKFTQPAVGSIKLMNTASANTDKLIPIKTNGDNTVAIATNALATGRWNIQINWNSNGRQYLYKQELYVNGQ